MIGKPTRGKQVDVKKAIELYQQGLSMAEVGRVLGHHHSIIAYHLYKNNIEIRPRKRKLKADTEELKKLYLEGYSTPEIGERFKMSSQAVYTRLVKNGIKTRNFSEALNNAVNRGRAKRYFGKDNYLWKGGRYLSKGYVHLTVDTKSVLEHRRVWEQYFGPIPEGWIVHHLNGNKLDNRIENLDARPRKMHSPVAIIEPYQKRICDLEKQIKEMMGGDKE